MSGSRNIPVSLFTGAAQLLAEATFLNDLTATFTRASSATDPVLGTYVGNNVRRRWPFFPIPGYRCNGDFLENLDVGAGTNLLLYSDDLTHATWTKNDCSATANQGIALDGVSLTMPKVAVTTATSPYIEQSWTLPRSDGTRVVLAAYVPVNSPGDVPALLFEVTTDSGANGFRGWFIPSTGLWGTTGLLGTGLFDYVDVIKERGHYRLLIKGRCSTGSAAARLRVYLVGGDNSTTAAAVGKYIYINSFQSTSRGVNNAGQMVSITSHYLTTSAAATRVADVLKVTFPNGGPGLNEGTMLVYHKPGYWGHVYGGTYEESPDDGGALFRVGASNGANSNRLTLGMGASISGIRTHGGGTQDSASVALGTLDTTYGIRVRANQFELWALTWKYNSVALWVNGIKVAEDTSTTESFDALTDSNDLYIQAVGYQGTFYIPRALLASELAVLAQAAGL